MNLLVLSSCGTSLLTNKAEPAASRLLFATADRTADQLSVGERHGLQVRAEAVEAALAAADDAEAASAAAELHALLALAREEAAADRRHVLVHSDTCQGAVASVILARWLERRGEPVERRTAGGLRSSDTGSFRLALADLARQLTGELSVFRRNGYRIVFNLTGGLKPVHGFLHTLGCVLADETVYIFEGSGRSLLRLPRLPVRFQLEESVLAHVDVLRRLAAGERVDRAEAAALPEALVLMPGGEAVLSELGHVVWAAVADAALPTRP